MASSNVRTRIVMHTVSGVVAVFMLVLLGMVVGMTTARAGAGTFTLSSPDVKDGGTVGNDFVFDGFGCTGKNMSPALRWSGVPAGTQSFAVTVFDPDAPTGSGWWHWVVYNLPANATQLSRGAGTGVAPLPKQANMGINDYGVAQFGGPCPPKGDKPHRYIFTVYALKVARFDVPDRASPAMIGFNINTNKIAEARITATYGR